MTRRQNDHVWRPRAGRQAHIHIPMSYVLHILSLEYIFMYAIVHTIVYATFPSLPNYIWQSQ